MLSPCSANTDSTRRSVPGSLRTANTSVVRVARRSPGASGGSAAPGRATTRNRVRLSVDVLDPVGQDLQPEQRRRHAATARRPRRAPRRRR